MDVKNGKQLHKPKKPKVPSTSNFRAQSVVVSRQVLHKIHGARIFVSYSALASKAFWRSVRSGEAHEEVEHLRIVWRAEPSHGIPLYSKSSANLKHARVMRREDLTGLTPSPARKPRVPQPGLSPLVISCRTSGLAY